MGINFFSGKKIEVPEIRYRSDMEMHDRFQNISSEILKLAMASIAVFGLFLTLLGNKDTQPSVLCAFHSNQFFWYSTFSLVFLGLSIGCALAHRYLASDGMFHHMHAIKLLILLEEKDPQAVLNKTELEEIVKNDEKIRNSKFKFSQNLLAASAISLLFGASSLGSTFLIVFKFTN